MLDNFSAEDIFYLADTFYTALVGFVGMMIIFPPIKISKLYVPFFFIAKYIGNFLVNLTKNPLYHTDAIDYYHCVLQYGFYLYWNKSQ